MKKTIAFLAAVCLLAVANTANAQTPYEPMEKGAWTVNAGVGVGNLYDGIGTGFGVRAAVEHGMWEAGPGIITLGGELGWAHTSDKNILASFNINYNQFTVAARSAWHHGWNVAGLDTYGGITMGPAFQFASVSGVADGNDNQVAFYFGFFLGASYFFTPNFGVNAELGYSANLFQVGVVYKF